MKKSRNQNASPNGGTANGIPTKVMMLSAVPTKLFLGGLAPNTTSESLRQAFETECGILDAVVMCDKFTGKSRGFGFITFPNPSIAASLAGQTRIVDGRRIELKYAVPSAGANPQQAPATGTAPVVMPPQVKTSPRPRSPGMSTLKPVAPITPLLPSNSSNFLSSTSTIGNTFGGVGGGDSGGMDELSARFHASASLSSSSAPISLQSNNNNASQSDKSNSSSEDPIAASSSDPQNLSSNSSTTGGVADTSLLDVSTSSVLGAPPTPGPGSTPKLFVGGLASGVTETDLRSYFGSFGTVTEAMVMYDRETRRSRGFGFVTFISPDAVDMVMQNPHHSVCDKWVEVKRAESKEAMARRLGRTSSMGSNASTGSGSSYISRGSRYNSNHSPHSGGSSTYGSAQQQQQQHHHHSPHHHQQQQLPGHNQNLLDGSMSVSQLIHAYNPYPLNPLERSFSHRQQQQQQHNNKTSSSTPVTPGGGSAISNTAQIGTGNSSNNHSNQYNDPAMLQQQQAAAMYYANPAMFEYLYGMQYYAYPAGYVATPGSGESQSPDVVSSTNETTSTAEQKESSVAQQPYAEYLYTPTSDPVSPTLQATAAVGGWIPAAHAQQQQQQAWTQQGYDANAHQRWHEEMLATVPGYEEYYQQMQQMYLRSYYAAQQYSATNPSNVGSTTDESSSGGKPMNAASTTPAVI